MTCPGATSAARSRSARTSTTRTSRRTRSTSGSPGSASSTARTAPRTAPSTATGRAPRGSTGSHDPTPTAPAEALGGLDSHPGHCRGPRPGPRLRRARRPAQARGDVIKPCPCICHTGDAEHRLGICACRTRAANEVPDYQALYLQALDALRNITHAQNAAAEAHARIVAKLVDSAEAQGVITAREAQAARKAYNAAASASGTAEDHTPGPALAVGACTICDDADDPRCALHT